MGDYYKIKKILLILIIICTILRIINNSKVFASEAVEVTPTWNDGSYTNQTDNNYLTLMENQLQIQEKIIINLLYNLSNNRTNDLIARINNIRQRIALNWNGSYNRFIWFGINVDSSIDAAWYYQEVSATNLNNIFFQDAILNNGYKLTNVPFYSFNRNGINGLYYFKADGSLLSGIASGSASIPCAEVGYYSPRWVEVFKEAGLINSTGEYETELANIENNQQLVLQQEQVQSAIQRDTNSVVTNSYNYIKDENIEEITSLGFSSPDVEEKIDLDDVFDQFETLLTDENYTPKQFSFWLPNGDETIFSLSPTLLEDNLTRIGGNYIIQIIHAIWFISLYGWYIFAYFGILGKLISGDWFHLVKGSAPVTRLVKMSVGSITGSGGF